MRIEGAILVGGQSRRMGRDKCGLVLGAKTVLERLADAAFPVVQRLRLVGTERPDFEGRGFEVQPDLRPGLGPLSGVHAALATAVEPAVLVLACDLPFVTTEFLRGLAERLSSSVDAVVPRDAVGPVPVCALYRTRALGFLERQIARRELSARAFACGLRVRFVQGEELSKLDPNGVCLLNLNTPSDYERALAIVAEEESL